MAFPVTNESEAPFAVNKEQLVLTRLTDDGLPTGVSSMIGDYSVTPVVFFAGPPEGKVWHIKNLDIYIQGAGNITSNGYGPVTALPNGILIEINADGAPVFPGVTIRSTGEFKLIPGIVTAIEEAGPGDNYLNAEWEFGRAASPVVLRFGDTLSVTARDNLTGLTEHLATVSGFSLTAS